MSAAQLTPAVPRPAHVPEALVYDFDLHNDPALRADAHARVLDIVRTAPPVFWTPRNGGAWVLASHQANYVASRDTETFSSEFMPMDQIKAMLAALPAGAPHIPLPIPINLDPPEHGKYRAPLQKVFSPRTIMGLKESIRVLAAELIEAVKAEGRCEFMAAIGEPLPVKVFLRMLGLPLDRYPEYRRIVKEHMEAIDPTDRAGTMRRMQEISAAMRETVLDRKDNPQDDIISMLWKLEIDGVPVNLADMENYGVLLFIAGLDTVMNGMGLGVHRLASDQALQARLRADPKLIPEAAEELLRRYTFTVPMRLVAKDNDLLGVEMKAGERTIMFLPGADLDAAEFPNPEAFDLARENNVHIAFGVGPHRCLGSHLARVELQVLYEEMLARLPAFRLDPAQGVTYHGGHVIGPDTVPLVWDV